MNLTKFNQTINSVERILILQKAQKTDMNEAIRNVQKTLVENGVNATVAQAAQMTEEYFAKRAAGEK